MQRAQWSQIPAAGYMAFITEVDLAEMSCTYQLCRDRSHWVWHMAMCRFENVAISGQNSASELGVRVVPGILRCKMIGT
jgi:uncharacterized protein YmfQ (DUF2313 family)